MIKLLEFFQRKKFQPVNVKSRAVFRYKVGYIRDGKRHWISDWRDNLILDSGLNKVATTRWADCWQTCIFGDQVSPTPVSRNGGAVNFSQALTTITADAGFFVAQDTGRLFKFDSGEECYLTYVNATTATASISRTVGSGPGTVWYVNQTAVESVLAYSTSYGSTGGDNGTSAIGNVVTQQRTFIGDALAAPATLTEIGFNSSASNVNIFDRDIVVGGFSLLAGDQPLAVGQLILTLDGTTISAVGNVATGYDSSGDQQIVSGGVTGNLLSAVASTGFTTASSSTVLEPEDAGGGFPRVYVRTADFTIPAFTNGMQTVAGSASVCTSGPVPQTYSSGNFYRDKLVSFNITDGVGTIYGVSFEQGGCAWIQKFTSTFSKLSTQTLTFTFRFSWQRILVN